MILQVVKNFRDEHHLKTAEKNLPYNHRLFGVESKNSFSENDFDQFLLK